MTTNLRQWIQGQLETLGEPTLEETADNAAIVSELKLRLCEAGYFDLSLSLPVENTKRKVSAVAQLKRVLEAIETPTDTDGPLSVQQTADRIGVAPDTVLDWIRKGYLKASNVGKGLQRGRYRIDPNDLSLFLESRKINRTL